MSYQTRKRCSEKLGYGSPSNLISATTDGCLHMIQFSNTWPGNFFPYQLFLSLNMTLLANFGSTPQGTGTLYSNYIYIYLFCSSIFQKGPNFFYIKVVPNISFGKGNYHGKCWSKILELDRFMKNSIWNFTK